MIPAATLYPFWPSQRLLRLLAGRSFISSRVERQWQERHVKEFSEHVPAPGPAVALDSFSAFTVVVAVAPKMREGKPQRGA